MHSTVERTPKLFLYLQQSLSYDALNSLNRELSRISFQSLVKLNLFQESPPSLSTTTQCNKNAQHTYLIITIKTELYLGIAQI